MQTLKIATPRWCLPLLNPARYKGAHGGRGCVHPDTPIDTPSGQIKVSEFKGGMVYAHQDGAIVEAYATPSVAYDEQQLYLVTLDDGTSISVTDQHRFLTQRGWVRLEHLSMNDAVVRAPLLGVSSCIHDLPTLTGIKSICKHDRLIYWDLHVPVLENYLSNGIVNHNSGKSHFFAEMLVEAHVMDPNRSTVCVREVQKSLGQSVKRLIEAKIESLGVGSHFEVQEAAIKSKRGTGRIIFQGMQNHTADSIKSLEGYDCAWVEEAHSLSQKSLDLLRPTIRKPNSELWFTWNPNTPDDPVDSFLRGPNKPKDAVVIQVNHADNPWFPDVLKSEMAYDKSRDVDKYAHVWLGGYAQSTEKRVFRNWRIEDFESPADAVHRFGADWGFAVDPTVLVRCHIVGRNLFVDFEAYKVGCDIVDTPALFLTVPESEKWPIIADGSRPETISHMRKNGFSKIMAAVKGPRSVEEGVEFLKSYDIVVHPRCVHTIDELSMYSYRTDPLTGKILPVLQDKKNHVIDALRYACENVRRIQSANNTGAKIIPMPTLSRW